MKKVFKGFSNRSKRYLLRTFSDLWEKNKFFFPTHSLWR